MSVVIHRTIIINIVITRNVDLRSITYNLYVSVTNCTSVACNWATFQLIIIIIKTSWCIHMHYNVQVKIKCDLFWYDIYATASKTKIIISILPLKDIVYKCTHRQNNYDLLLCKFWLIFSHLSLSLMFI